VVCSNQGGKNPTIREKDKKLRNAIHSGKTTSGNESTLGVRSWTQTSDPQITPPKNRGGDGRVGGSRGNPKDQAGKSEKLHLRPYWERVQQPRQKGAEGTNEKGKEDRLPFQQCRFVKKNENQDIMSRAKRKKKKKNACRGKGRKK